MGIDSKKRVTLIPGDGIGMEISEVMMRVVEAAGAAVEWDFECAGERSQMRYGEPINRKLLESIERNKVVLKGPLQTPKGSGHRSLNVYLRRHFDAYAGVRPARSFKGVRTRWKDIDIVVIRENLEGLYSGVEFAMFDGATDRIRKTVYEVTNGEVDIPNDAAIAFQIITQSESLRVARFAFDYAQKNGRRKVTVVDKSNIHKATDGAFFRAAQKVSEEFPDIEFDEILYDNCTSQMMRDPSQFDVLLCINEQGDSLSSQVAETVGGTGLVGTGNIGDKFAIFEATHGTAPDIAGQNKANPTAMLMSSAMMLRHIGEVTKGDRIERAVRVVIREGKYLTGDITRTKRSPVSTDEFGEAVIEKLL